MLVQTVMTYWYLGVREVIEDVRKLQPHAKIILGGVYATLCPGHARSLGADQVLEGQDLKPLGLPLSDGLPLWESVDAQVGIVKITEGCPFRCTYCSVPLVYPAFAARPLETCMEEVRHLVRLGARNVAFYDDALLFQPERILLPFPGSNPMPTSGSVRPAEKCIRKSSALPCAHYKKRVRLP